MAVFLWAVFKDIDAPFTSGGFMKAPQYAKMERIRLSDRKWPDRQITESPLWCAVDLRDGNQALPNPMTPEQKLEYFKLLVSIGFKEIEIGFPSASEDDFSFCRKLIEDNLIPDDVMISVLTQSRPHLISQTIKALKGIPRAVVHVYIATSELHMNYVFGMTEESVLKNIEDSIRQVRDESKTLTGSLIGLEFSPEEFTDTNIPFASAVCEKVIETWNPGKDEKVIINLPMTVERRLPNEYADMIEQFIRTFRCNDKAVISLHAHNDMGSAVAATTMSLMAGAQRVEGTLFGHGERTGNVDLVTIALNLSYLGIDTGLDFSRLPEIVSVVERVSGLPVHPRHPYAGELVFTAFSGSHQDAINKGFIRKDELSKRFAGWKIPYLHVDPSSLGRSFEKFIRINSQSGKGGIAFVMERDHNISLPKWVQTDFAQHVQSFADRESRELSSAEVYDIFRKTYLSKDGPLSLINYWPRPRDNDPGVVEGELHVKFFDLVFKLKAEGNGPISAFVNALREIAEIPPFVLEQYAEDSLGHSADAEAACFVKISGNGRKLPAIGVGFNPNVIQAAANAVICGINNLYGI